MNIDPKRTPDELAEEAMGLIAVAMFRAKERAGTHRDGIEIGEAFMSTLSGMLMDFRRNLAKEPAK